MSRINDTDSGLIKIVVPKVLDSALEKTEKSNFVDIFFKN